MPYNWLILIHNIKINPINDGYMFKYQMILEIKLQNVCPTERCYEQLLF